MSDLVSGGSFARILRVIPRAGRVECRGAASDPAAPVVDLFTRQVVA